MAELIPFLYSAGDFDYEPLVNESLVISFNAQIGASNCLTVTIIGDDCEEENETFLVTFTAHPKLNPEDVITGQNQVTVTIVDNGDGKYIDAPYRIVCCMTGKFCADEC